MYASNSVFTVTLAIQTTGDRKRNNLYWCVPLSNFMLTAQSDLMDFDLKLLLLHLFKGRETTKRATKTNLFSKSSLSLGHLSNDVYGRIVMHGQET